MDYGQYCATMRRKYCRPGFSIARPARLHVSASWYCRLTWQAAAMSPLFDRHPFDVCGRFEGERSVELWARNHEGALAMQASAELA